MNATHLNNQFEQIQEEGTLYAKHSLIERFGRAKESRKEVFDLILVFVGFQDLKRKFEDR